MTLHAVPDSEHDGAEMVSVTVPERFDDEGEMIYDRQEPCPRAPYDFEGDEVASTGAKMTSVANLNIGDRRLKRDDMVVMEVVGRVVSVAHINDDKHNTLVRMHTIKVVDAEFKRAHNAAGGVEWT